MNKKSGSGRDNSVWTTPSDIRKQLQALWDKGLLLSVLAGEPDIFPLKLKIKTPGSRELSDRFSAVRDWITQLSSKEGLYRIVWRQIHHRVLGTNDIPTEIWIDRMDNALKLIQQERAAESFIRLVDQTRLMQPQLLSWLRKKPLRALVLAEDWSHLLLIVDWLLKNPRPNIYVRQLSLPGIHTKLVETHRAVLAELLDLVLPPESIADHYSGISGFNQRYGFKEKPLRVRFRLLNSDTPLLNTTYDQDITLTADAFADIKPDVSRVFITENEINFLAFPRINQAMIIFGAGYGFENIARAKWLHEKPIYYWGDIDTHGFAILHQLRGYFPHVRSLMMDQATLLAHQAFWVVEAKQETGELVNLNAEEQRVYDDLRNNRLGSKVRLEQERVPYDDLLKALAGLN